MDPSVLEAVRQGGSPTPLPVHTSLYSADRLSLTSCISQLSADQIGQLYELFQASQDVWLTPEELEAKLKAEGRTEEGIPAGQVLPDLGKANRIGGDGEGR
jgi:hypothetical protein